MGRFFLLGVIVAGMLAAVPGTTQADQFFDFSFTNTDGNTAGTVTGVIDLNLIGDGTVAASHVTITSYPSAVGNIGTPPIDATTWATQVDNSFTVSGGQITSADFDASGTGLPGAGSLFLQSSPADSQLQVVQQHEGRNVAGLATFTPAPAPEPGSIALVGTGLLSLGGVVIGRRRKKPTAD